jgi:hypothetical protein
MESLTFEIHHTRTLILLVHMVGLVLVVVVFFLFNVTVIIITTVQRQKSSTGSHTGAKTSHDSTVLFYYNN